MGALAAVPVGLGLAAALVVAAPQGPHPLRTGARADTPVPDNALPPAQEGSLAPRSPAPSASSATPEEERSPAEPAAEAGDAVRPASPSATPDSPDSDEDGDRDGERREPDDPAAAALSATAEKVVDLTNKERAASGCEPLRVDARLTTASERHSRDMARRDYMAHETPEGVGPDERAQRAGYDAWGGENLASGYGDAASVVAGWMASEGHRKNILNCDFVAVGVGEADRMWAQNFGYE